MNVLDELIYLNSIILDLNIAEDSKFVCYNSSILNAHDKIKSFTDAIEEYEGSKMFLSIFIGHGGIQKKNRVYFFNEYDLQQSYKCIDFIRRVS